MEPLMAGCLGTKSGTVLSGLCGTRQLVLNGLADDLVIQGVMDACIAMPLGGRSFDLQETRTKPFSAATRVGRRLLERAFLISVCSLNSSMTSVWNRLLKAHILCETTI